MLTVQHTLSLDPLAGVEILAGAGGLNRIVRRTVVIEVPEVIEQTTEGDLLMTSVDTFVPNQNTFYAMLAALDQRKVAGLLIKGKLAPGKVMDTLLAAAEQHHLPLLNLQRNVSYSEIIMAFAADQLEQQSKLMRRSEGLRQRFMSAMLSGGGLEQFAQLICREVGGNSVVVTDAGHRRLLAYCPLHENCGVSTPLGELPAAFRSVSPYLAIIETEAKLAHVEAEWEAIWMRWTIAVDQFELGHVYLHGCKRNLHQSDTVVLEQASASIALELLKLRALHDMEQRRSEFVEALVAGDEQSGETLLRNARMLGWRLQLPAYVLVFGPQATREGEWEDAGLAKLAARVLGEENEHDLFWFHQDNLILIYPTEGRSGGLHQENVMDQSARLLAALEAHYGVTFFAGISQIVDEYGRLSLGIAQAHQALTLSQTLASPPRIMHFNDVGIYSILLRHPNAHDLREFMARTIGPLLQHDEESQYQLIETLQVYLAHDRNMRAAAAYLDLHYNSMRYRLQRITEILGSDWEEPSVRLSVEIALKILMLQSPNVVGKS